MKKITFKKSSLLLCFAFATLFSLSCKKAGLGGSATIVAFPKHHGAPIYGATVYVKFNAKDFPGSSISSYDATFVGEPDEDHVHLKELKKGDYYFYAVGYDSSISEMVYGGQPFTIKRKDRSDEQDIDIAVTE